MPIPEEIIREDLNKVIRQAVRLGVPSDPETQSDTVAAFLDATKDAEFVFVGSYTSVDNAGEQKLEVPTSTPPCYCPAALVTQKLTGDEANVVPDDESGDPIIDLLFVSTFESEFDTLMGREGNEFAAVRVLG